MSQQVRQPSLGDFRKVAIEELLGTLSDQERALAPDSVWLCGDERIVQPGVKRLAIIGSRNPKVEALRVVFSIARSVRYRSDCITIISGLATGIDTAAHWASLTIGVPTAAVLPCPPNHCYPKENILLKRAICKYGACISQFEPHEELTKDKFVRRNKLIALLSDVIFVAAADRDSGCKHAVEAASRLGKPVIFSEWVDPTSDWAKRALRSGRAEYMAGDAWYVLDVLDEATR